MAHKLSIFEKMAIRDAPHVRLDGKKHVLPSVVVGVVGMAHVPGILEEWTKIEQSQMTVRIACRLFRGLADSEPNLDLVRDC